MKKIMLVCGTGIVTSTHVAMKITKILNDRGYEGKFKITQFKTVEMVPNSSYYDFCVSTTAVPEGAQCPVVKGVPFLSGIGTEAAIAEIIKLMDK